ncbi:uncharacterized protein G2W53_026369 [Senna tora]|uniref:Uncharacterized protein n=1 Tax=Senna tora TaxID=362788 RepID=A0A834TH21_9FABA|nr:uncharacterized protein G2W53_026369 [Senna tora]
MGSIFNRLENPWPGSLTMGYELAQ